MVGNRGVTINKKNSIASANDTRIVSQMPESIQMILTCSSGKNTLKAKSHTGTGFEYNIST